eukprot:jgi/Mesen1/6366/ME000328S05639
MALAAGLAYSPSHCFPCLESTINTNQSRVSVRTRHLCGRTRATRGNGFQSFSADVSHLHNGALESVKSCLRPVSSARRSIVQKASRQGGQTNRDEDGVIEDMEVFLKDLSLEYDSVWDTKPAWCQPWTILLTGASGVAGSWLVLHSFILTGLVSLTVGLWWFVFLLAYPQAYSKMIAERRQMVVDGNIDTYGSDVRGPQ